MGAAEERPTGSATVPPRPSARRLRSRSSAGSSDLAAAAQGPTLVHFSAQPEPFLPLSIPLKHALNTP
jgi:hypothetical protein